MAGICKIPAGNKINFVLLNKYCNGVSRKENIMHLLAPRCTLVGMSYNWYKTLKNLSFKHLIEYYASECILHHDSILQ